MFGNSNKFVCVSLSEETLRIAEVSGRGRGARLNKVHALDVKGLPEQELNRKVIAALNSFNARKANVLLIVPTGHVTTKNVDIPSVDPEEIKSIVHLQAGRHTPFSRDEIQFGYINLGARKDNYTKVLLTIANKNTIRKQLALLERGRIRVKKVCFGPEGLAPLYPEAAGMKVLGIIDIGAQSTDFVVARGGKVIASRNIPVGKNHLAAEGSAAQDKLIEELGKTIEAYKSEDGGEVPEKCVFTSNDQFNQEVIALASAKLNWSVIASPYFDHVKTSAGTKKKIGSVFAKQSFADLAAVGANIGVLQVNLLPEEVLIQKAIEKQGKEVFRFSLLIFIILIFVTGAIGWKIYTHDSVLKKVTDEYAPQRQEVKDLEGLSKRTQTVEKFLENRMAGLDAVQELYRTMPKEIYLSDIAVDENGVLGIQGVSKISSLIYKYRTTLKESPLFADVNVKSQAAKKDRGEDVFSFDIEIVLKGFDADVSAEKNDDAKKQGE